MADAATPHPEARFQSATDVDHRRTSDIPPTPPQDEVPFAVLTTHGFQPFFPPPDSQPPPSPEAHTVEYDNPLNPKGGPSLSYPQQATPLTSQQEVLSPEEILDDNLYRELVTVQDGLAPDDPRNPRGTPDYIVEGPSPQSNPLDEQHDGRTSHEQTEPPEGSEPSRYWEGDDNG